MRLILLILQWCPLLWCSVFSYAGDKDLKNKKSISYSLSFLPFYSFLLPLSINCCLKFKKLKGFLWKPIFGLFFLDIQLHCVSYNPGVVWLLQRTLNRLWSITFLHNSSVNFSHYIFHIFTDYRFQPQRLSKLRVCSKHNCFVLDLFLYSFPRHLLLVISKTGHWWDGPLIQPSAIIFKPLIFHNLNGISEAICR